MKPKCGLCGKRSRILCPTLSRNICSLCCAAKRGTEIECASECTRYPLGPGNYDLFLELDRKLSTRISRRLAEEIPGDSFRRTLRRFAKPHGGSKEAMRIVGEQAVFYYLLTYHDPQGLRIADKWAADGFPGLGHDERHLMACYQNACGALVEVQRIVEPMCLECQDHFSGKRFSVFDRSLTRQASRFIRFLCYAAHLPHYGKLLACTAIPALNRMEYADALGEAHREYQAQHPGSTMNDYLTAEFPAAYELLFSLIEKREQAVRESDLRECVSLYRMECPPEEVMAVLDARPDFERAPQADCRAMSPSATAGYDWLALGESACYRERETVSGGIVFDVHDNRRMVRHLASLAIEGETLRLTAISGSRHEFCKDLLDRCFGPKLILSRERVVDTAKQVMDREAPAHEAHAPSAPLDQDPGQRGALEAAFRRFYERFLDDRVPALDHMTPRQAATDPDMRPRLVELMKQHVYGAEARRMEQNLDCSIDWVLRELGLDELL